MEEGCEGSKFRAHYSCDRRLQHEFKQGAYAAFRGSGFSQSPICQDVSTALKFSTSPHLTEILCTETAQTNAAAQGVEMAQAALEMAEANYEKSIERQAKTAAALAQVEQKLKSLQSTGQTLDQIKSILRDAISILVDLSVQIQKIEDFFTMLQTVIEHIIMPKVKDFEQDLSKAGDRAFKNKIIKLDQLAQQTIYMTTLQLKGYFSMLQDIAAICTEVHRKYILRGMELCSNLSKNAAVGNASKAEQDALADYSEQSAVAVQSLVKTKQDEMLSGLKARAKKAAEEASDIARVLASANMVVDDTTRSAIEAGKKAGGEQANKVLNAAGEPLTQSKAIMDGNDF